MATNRKIRVGIVGANPSRGFASIAHIPALQGLPEFEISAVRTTQQDSADAAARYFGAPLAFCDAEKLAQPSGCRSGHSQREGARSLPAGHGRNRGRETRLLRMAARP